MHQSAALHVVTSGQAVSARPLPGGLLTAVRSRVFPPTKYLGALLSQLHCQLLVLLLQDDDEALELRDLQDLVLQGGCVVLLLGDDLQQLMFLHQQLLHLMLQGCHIPLHKGQGCLSYLS